MLGDFLEAEGDQAGGRSHRRIGGAGLHRRVDFVRGQGQHRCAGGLQDHVHFLAAAAHLHALGIFRIDQRRGTAGNAAGLPDPADDDDALLQQQLGDRLADLGILPGSRLLVGGDQPGHETQIEFGHLAAGIGDRVQADVQCALAQRAELGVGLHQRRTRIDLECQRALAARLDFLGELAAQAVAEIAGVEGAAGKLVGNLQGFGGKCSSPEHHQRRRGKRSLENRAAGSHCDLLLD